jgi:hypothetical protein
MGARLDHASYVEYVKKNPGLLEPRPGSEEAKR